MKRVLLALACCGLLAAPAFAQEEKDLGSKSREELLAELHKLMKDASKEMDGLEKELAKTSLGPAKADIVAERMKKVRDAMKEGKLDELPEGLREYMKENPDEAAKLAGKSAEEFKQLAEDEEKLRELLGKNPELLRKLAENEHAFEDIMQRQVAIEKRVEDALKRAEESTSKAEENIDGSLEVAHELKSRSS
ncbi:MAG: hypothetical protein H6841_11360 [Planctomycetes bacterium]|nr:hypothetical protein [Planctomycetota bacterium]MCB9935343.1 hypothetical protein [Planctomycetota bacterium]